MTVRRFAGRCVEAIRGMAARRSDGVSRLRLEARSAIVARQRARQHERQHLRVRLRRHRAAILSSLRAPAAETRAPGAIVVDEPTSTACAGVWELRVAQPEPQRRDPVALRDRVVRVIARHPDGIVARDLGNELGVDWRRVVGLTPELLDAGVIERIGPRFYPTAGKASGR